MKIFFDEFWDISDPPMDSKDPNMIKWLTNIVKIIHVTSVVSNYWQNSHFWLDYPFKQKHSLFAEMELDAS